MCILMTAVNTRAAGGPLWRRSTADKCGSFLLQGDAGSSAAGIKVRSQLTLLT